MKIHCQNGIHVRSLFAGAFVLAMVGAAAPASAASVEIRWSGFITGVQGSRNLPLALTQSALSNGQPVILSAYFDSDLVSADQEPEPGAGIYVGGLDHVTLTVNGVSATATSDVFAFLAMYTDDGGGNGQITFTGQLPPETDPPTLGFWTVDTVDGLAGLPLGTLADESFPTSNATYGTTPFNGITYQTAGGGAIFASVETVQIIVPGPASGSLVALAGFAALRRRR